MKRVNIDKTWKEPLKEILNSEVLKNLKSFLTSEIEKGKTIYPHGSEIFSAFNLCPLDKVKVVIIGQDPYHGPDQAHGLCFSVKRGVRPPPSLKNIYKEMHTDLGLNPPDHGFLESWAGQGVLLLNAVLTVEKSNAGSHRGKGWEQFTDAVIDYLSQENEHLVFILWGRDAQKKGEKIDRSKHLVLESAHPSPFSAHRFYGNKHFSKTNAYLKTHGKNIVDWRIL
ncbi:MAG: uracil-DNA glycosylase [Bacteriovoracaceae bacterium]|nr:uracil-DNA glycosylase [Bacteriovoracaceae bacterium]